MSHAAPSVSPAAAAVGRLSPARLAALMQPPRPAPVSIRDGRWWAGAVLLAISALIVALAVQISFASGLQHARDQAVGYDELRTSLAKAVTPVGQLDYEEKMVAYGTPVALLEIPSIGLREVVSQGTTGTVLRSGPGHSADTVMPGQEGTSTILGRQASYGGPFNSLTRLAIGAEITVTTGQGAQTFTVFGTRKAGDPLPSALAAGQSRLELVTADGPALLPNGALYIDAQLTTKAVTTPAFQFSALALPEADKPMAMDPSAWIGVFFSMQWLILASLGALWLRRRWGAWQTWIVSAPVILALAIATADGIGSALPNLI